MSDEAKRSDRFGDGAAANVVPTGELFFDIFTGDGSPVECPPTE
jgi:hypothetical protein